MSDYDDDILIWSERQGELLRRARPVPATCLVTLDELVTDD
jgi:hypothetical protein